MMASFTERLKPGPTPLCKCYTPPFHYTDYAISHFGVDKTNGRFADVTLETCLNCGTKWIKYLIEFEAFSQSGRWYRGIIADNSLKDMTPEKVVTFLENLDWFIFGGSYFSSTGMYGKGKVQADL